MQKEEAWKLFVETGKIEDYLEYRNICYNDEYEDDDFETYKDNWNSNKRNRF